MKLKVSSHLNENSVINYSPSFHPKPERPLDLCFILMKELSIPLLEQHNLHS